VAAPYNDEKPATDVLRKSRRADGRMIKSGE
jgi:hypothetical protein